MDQKIKLKKTIAFILTFALLFALMPVVAMAENPTSGNSGVDGDNVTWALTGNGSNLTLTISGVGDMADYPYYGESPWYASRESIKSIVIASGVTSIGVRAFYTLGQVTSVSIANTVTSIREEAFSQAFGSVNNPNEGFSIMVPGSVKDIGKRAFSNNSSIVNVTLNEGLLTIGDEAFTNIWQGYGGQTLTFPSTLTSIGASAFGATYYKIISISENIISIGSGAFSSNDELEEISVSEENAYYKSVDGILFDKDGQTFMQYPNGRSDVEYIIPDGTKIIDKRAFAHSDLTMVTIPEGVHTIGEEAFINSGQITLMNIPESVSSIGKNAFLHLSSVTEFTVSGENMEFMAGSNGELLNKDGSTLLYYPTGNTRTTYSVPTTVHTIAESSLITKYVVELIIPESVTTLESNSISTIFAVETEPSWKAIYYLEKITFEGSPTTIDLNGIIYLSNSTRTGANVVVYSHDDATTLNNYVGGKSSLTRVSLDTPLIDVSDSITFTDSVVTYDGTPKSIIATTTDMSGGTFSYDYVGTNGTSYGPSTTTPTNAGTYSVTATYNSIVAQGAKTTVLTINPVTMDITNLTFSIPSNHDYTGSEQGIGNVTAISGGTVTVKYNNSPTLPVNVGTYSVTVDVAANGNYASLVGLSLGDYTINKLTLTATASANNKNYDGTTDATVTITLTNAVVTDVVTLSASGTFADANVGNDKVVSVMGFTLSGNAAGNYNAPSAVSNVVTANIVKASVNGVPSIINVKENTARGYLFELASLLPDNVIPSQVSAYSVGTVNDDSGIFTLTPTVDGSMLIISINETAQNGQTATIPIIMESANYNRIGGEITVNVTDKEIVVLTSADIADRVYDGSPTSYIASFDKTGIPAEDVEYTWSNGVNGPVNAGDNYTLTVSLKNESDYVLAAPVVMTFSITKASLTLLADDKSIQKGAQLPTFTFTISGLKGTDAWSTVKDEDPVIASSTADNAKTGSYPITVANGSLNGGAGANYEISSRKNGSLVVQSSTIDNNDVPVDSISNNTIEPVSPVVVVTGESVNSTVEVKSTVQNGEVKANVTGDTVIQQLEDLKKLVSDDPSKQGLVEIKLSDVKADAKSVEVFLPANALKEFDGSGVNLKINAEGMGSMILDSAAILTIAEAVNASENAEVRVAIQKVDVATLSAQMQEIVKDAVIYDFSVMVDDTAVSDFKGGTARLSIPYDLIEDGNPNAVTVYYLKEDGTLELVNGIYNRETGNVEITLRHFSKYAVKVSELEYDVTSGWYNDSLDWAAHRGLLDKFIVDGNINAAQTVSREDFIVAYMKANSITPLASFTVEQFTDVSGENAAYIHTARELGIVSGTGGNRFEPDRVAMRVEFYQIMKNFLDAKLSRTPKTDTGKTSMDFLDGNLVPSWAKPAVDELVKRALIEGDGNSLLIKDMFNIGTLSVVLKNSTTGTNF